MSLPEASGTKVTVALARGLPSRVIRPVTGASFAAPPPHPAAARASTTAGPRVLRISGLRASRQLRNRLAVGDGRQGHEHVHGDGPLDGADRAVAEDEVDPAAAVQAAPAVLALG